MSLYFLAPTISQKNVGVNNSSPQFTLDVRSHIDSVSPEIHLSNPSDSRFLRLFSGSSIFPHPAVFWKDAHHMRFATNAGGFSEKMRIQSDGRVGIGNISPAALLDVNGRIKLGEDGSEDVAGQMRWNNADKSFEGHDGTNWLSLGKSKSKTIGMSEFQASATGDQILRELGLSSGAFIDDGGGLKPNNMIQIPLTFNANTSIDSIKMIIYDNDINRKIQIGLVRIFETSSGAGYGSTVTSSLNSASHQTIDFIGSVYFQDKLQTFFVAYPVNEDTTGVTDWGPGGIKIRSITVYYHE